jgi:hypothetical protein
MSSSSSSLSLSSSISPTPSFGNLNSFEYPIIIIHNSSGYLGAFLSLQEENTSEIIYCRDENGNKIYLHATIDNNCISNNI